MHGALLRTGKSDEFIAMGETGQPVYKAALQIIAALTRKNPLIAKFLAVPKSNEQGSVIDWYSPVQGDVIPWSAATEGERDDARVKLNAFKASIAEMSQSLILSGDKSKQSDLVIFGKLLGLAPFSPDDAYVYIVKTERLDAQGVSELYDQPVLSFWGFILSEDDRQREPLFFLAPRQAPVLSGGAEHPGAAPLLSPPPAADVIQVSKPWWRRFWWLWPLLMLLLLLLLLSLLRGCMPDAKVPGFDLPGLSAPDLVMPDVRVPGVGLGGAPVLNGAVPAAPSGSGLPDLPREDAAPAGDTPQPPEEQPQTPPEPAAEPAPPGETPQPPTLDEDASGEPAQPPALSIPPDADEGPADFLDGQYRAGAGIQDRRTGKPLRLEYDFKDGQGNVTVSRPDGVSCTGAVGAAMVDGSLAINSQGLAGCTDGSNYDMPQVQCKPGAQSIADCAGSYGNEQFPMSMRKVGE
jgi:hypothetical protein